MVGRAKKFTVAGVLATALLGASLAGPVNAAPVNPPLQPVGVYGAKKIAREALFGKVKGQREIKRNYKGLAGETYNYSSHVVRLNATRVRVYYNFRYKAAHKSGYVLIWRTGAGVRGLRISIQRD